ncbi:MAG: hypothetical protein LC667_17145 [Thioalkalivibrio sp.]|nr:hypothetical protein [Thioalkalivibrio sp.]
MRSTQLVPQCVPGYAVAFTLVLSASGCTGAPAEAGPDLREGDRVRFVAPGYSAQARIGVIGMAGTCLTVMVPDQLPSPRRFDVVPVDSLTALEVSRRPGDQGDPDASRGAPAPDATADEEWIPVPVAGIKRRYGSCTPVM